MCNLIRFVTLINERNVSFLPSVCVCVRLAALILRSIVILLSVCIGVYGCKYMITYVNIFICLFAFLFRMCRMCRFTEEIYVCLLVISAK